MAKKVLKPILPLQLGDLKKFLYFCDSLLNVLCKRTLGLNTSQSHLQETLRGRKNLSLRSCRPNIYTSICHLPKRNIATFKHTYTPARTTTSC